MTAETIRKLEDLQDRLSRWAEGAAMGGDAATAPRASRAYRDVCEILASLKQSAGPGLPWVSVDTPPTRSDADVGNEVLWGSDTALQTGDYKHPPEWATHWCDLRHVPVPDSEGWVDAGEWDIWADGQDVTARLDEGRCVGTGTYRVMLRKVEEQSDG